MDSPDVLRLLRDDLRKRRSQLLEKLAHGLPERDYLKHCGRIAEIDDVLATLQERIKKANEATHDTDSEED